MNLTRIARPAGLLAGAALVLALGPAGCGGSAQSSGVTSVSPEVQKKTETMLNNMKAQMEAKHKNDRARRPRR